MTDFLSIPQHQLRVSGNTAGATASLSSGTVTLAGGNNITLSQAGNAVTISGAAAAGAQTAISGIAASNTTYTSGTVTFTGVGGGVTVSSNTGQRVDISVAAQSVQPETQTFIAGIQNSQTTYTSGTVNLSVVAGNLTIRSTTGQAFQFSASQTVQPETQTFVGGIAASNTTYTSGTVTITGVGGGITVSSNTGQRVDLSVAAQSVQTQGNLSMGVSTGGNTAGNTTVNTGSRFVLVASGNATASQATAAGASTVTISVGTQTVQTQDVLSAGVSNIGNSSGDTTVNTGSRLVFAGGNNITVSQGTAAGATTITISGPNVGGAQTGISGIANSQTTYTSGTVSLSELGAITIRSTTGNQYQLSVNAQTTQTQGILSMGVSTGGNTAGNTTVNTGSRMVIVASGNATASQATAAGASTITLSVGTQTVQTQDVLSVGVSTGGNTAGNTTVNTGSRFVLVGTNMVSLSQTTAAGATTVSINATQSVQTQSLIQALYDGANSITTGTVRLTNANGVTFSINGQTLSASVNDSISMHAVSNTTQSTAGTVHKSVMSFAGAGIASVGITGNSVLISVPAGGGAGDGGVFAGVSTMGNTAGSTGTVSTGNFVLVGTGPISLSQSTGAAGSAATVSIDAPATSSLSATGLVSISTNGSTISIGVPGTTQSLFDPNGVGSKIVGVFPGNATLAMQPWQVPVPYQHDRVMYPILYSQATNSTLTVTVSGWFGLYTKNASTLSLASSGSGTFSINGSGTNSSAQNSGLKYLSFGWTNTVTPGQYWLGAISRTTSAGANASLSNVAINYGVSNSAWSGLMGVAANASDPIRPGLGTWTVTSAGMPNSVAFSDLRGSATAAQRAPWVWFVSQIT